MNTILSFMDKLYSDSKTLSIVYVAGAILLFIFVVLLMFSLRKPDKKKEPKIIEPKIDNIKDETISEIKEEIKEDNKETTVIEGSQKELATEENQEELNEQSIFEKTVIIPLDELESKEKTIEEALNNVEKHKDELEENNNDEEKLEEPATISSEIPNVDDFVDNVVKKTYEKNEQFSSIYVGNNTSTIKLDKVMENLNVDKDVLDSIVPENEKTEIKKVELEENIVVREKEINAESKEEIQEEPKQETTNSLDNLKKALEEKKNEVNIKQDELKAKLEGLKKETLNKEDLLNKLNRK